MKLPGFLALAFAAALAGPVAAQAQTPAAPKAPATAKATFAGGCFWCVEDAFDTVPGVVATVSGYIGGQTKNPTYEQVSGGRTGHAEAVQVEYDPARVSYEKLVDVFWHNIDPTQKDAQFCDHGSQYRSAIFYHNEDQRRIAEASRTALAKNKPFKGEIVTQIVKADAFYPAEDYHQDYLAKHPESMYIVINDLPKLNHLRQEFPQMYVSR
jgi:peptide-methionine (S)-S-oxide reductase